MSCNCCIDDWICKCTPYDSFITVNAYFPNEVDFLITDKFGNVYQGPTTPSGRSVQIMLADLPDGFFTEFSGNFKLQFTNPGSYEPIDFIIQQNVDCIDLSVRGGNNSKEFIGLEYPS